MENPKISVIIPIYNVEDYLEDTLNCLLNQTFIDEMEVLMVDDGSSDNSRYIIEKYALDYDNFHAFHKENEGLSSSRNYGLDMAKGEYVHFLDADDNVVNDGYEKLYKIAIENNSDIVTAPLIRLRRYNVFDGKFYRNSLKRFEEDIPLTKFQNHPELVWDLFVTNKLYRLEFLNKNNLRTVEVDKAYCDDSPFSLNTYLLADHISISTDIFYYWRLRETGNLSITQKLTEVKTFYDRLYAINLCLNVINSNVINEPILKEIFLKILNHDLYLHFTKFHMYDEKYHLELIQKAKPILAIIPEEYKEELNSFNRIMYKMIEEEDMEGLVNFTSLESQLKKDPHIPNNINEKYLKYIDFDRDIINEDLIVQKEEICLDEDNLIVKFSKRINFLNSKHSYETIARLIDGEDNEFPLNEEDCEISIPIDLIKNKNQMRIKVECIFNSLKKESYITNNKREIIELDDFDIEIGIGANNLLFIDIRQGNDDLTLEIEDVLLEDDVFNFIGVSNRKISSIYIQNVVTFDKIFYEANAVKQDGNYEIEFSIPYADILSFNVRKWELKVNGGFKNIKLKKKLEFYMQYNFIYMTNLRKNILISSDFYKIYEKLNALRNEADDAKDENKKLVRENSKLSDENTELNQENAKLSQESSELIDNNTKLKETVEEYKSRKIIRIVDKLKKIF